MERPAIDPRPAAPPPAGDLSARPWDAIIVGAGPAGSIAARRLAQHGARVLLVDRAAFPREKTCGCCLSRAALGLLDQAGLGDLAARLGAVPIDSLDLRCGRLRRHISLAPGLCLSRAALDAALADAAVQAGATFLHDTSARLDTVGSPHQVTLTCAEETIHLRASVVIAADGVSGTFLRDHAALAPRIRKHARIGLSARLPHCLPGRAGAITMVVAQDVYAGLARTEDGGTQLAASADTAALRHAGGPGALIGRALADAGIQADLAGLHWHGTPALARRRPAPHCPGLFILGDAAGYEAPFTGEGMAWAMGSGLAAVPFILDTLRGAPDPAAWSRQRSRLLSPRMLRCRAIAAIVHRPRLLRAMLRVCDAIPGMISLLADNTSRPLPLPAPRGAAR